MFSLPLITSQCRKARIMTWTMDLSNWTRSHCLHHSSYFVGDNSCSRPCRARHYATANKSMGSQTQYQFRPSVPQASVNKVLTIKVIARTTQTESAPNITTATHKSNIEFINYTRVALHLPVKQFHESLCSPLFTSFSQIWP